MNRTAATWQLPAITIYPAILDRYAYEDCWKLAKASHDLTGWPIVAVGYRSANRKVEGIGWTHTAVRVPDGRCLDAYGLHEDNDLIDDYECFMRCDPEFPEGGVEELLEVPVDRFRHVLSVDPSEVDDDDVTVARAVIFMYAPDAPFSLDQP